MRILLANPNSTEALTEVCATLARQAASPGTLVIVSGVLHDECAALRLPQRA